MPFTVPLSNTSPVIIVGAGVFGLTSALHLSRAGYTNIHLFDKQPYHENAYAFDAGCDAASADENKILRASYGSGKLYQDMAFTAMHEWDIWNNEIAAANEADLPHGLTPEDKLWENCGFLRVGNAYDSHEQLTQDNFPPEIKDTQYRVSSAQSKQDALAAGIPASKLDPFRRNERGLPLDGVLDMTAGFVLASKACTYALHLCRLSGINLHLGAGIGEFSSLVTDPYNSIKTTGIRTKDGQSHPASLVIVACGGWTPFLLPATDRLLETTAGSIVMIKLPQDRQDLWTKYSPSNFPVWSWKMEDYERGTSNGGLYGLPRTKDGIVKFGFRGAKFTNYTFSSIVEAGRKVSYPITGGKDIPELALRTCRTFCAENLPDLLELEMHRGRLCWYTDSVDNSFLIDYVPGTEALMVASGGSGHGFKFLPVLGKHVVDVVEGRETDYTRLFAWRDVPTGKRNGLEEGEEGWRVLEKQRLAGTGQWKM